MNRYCLSISFAFACLLSTISNAQSEDVKILAWNIEIGGSDPKVIEGQIEAMRGKFDILALTEVPEAEFNRFGKFFQPGSYVIGTPDNTAYLLIAWNSHVFDMVDHLELKEWNNINLTQGLSPPLVVVLKHKATQKTFELVNNHFIRGSAPRRNQQAEAMVGWATKETKPIIAVGDYNMDYDFPSQKGNAAFDIMLKGDVFHWVKPTKLVDTNWADRDKDGVDDYPDSMLSFTFTSHCDWKSTVDVIVRDGDFPDDKTTSDHRPTLTTIKIE